MDKKLKIVLAASAGGHLVQLLRLQPCWQDHDIVFVSTVDVVKDKLARYGRVYIVGECNRQHPFRILQVLWRCWKVAIAERPDVVISTGAAPGLLMCLTARLFGAKLVWVDSIANVRRPSMSGRLIRPLCSLFLTQWQELQNPDKKIEYAGSVV